MAQYIGVCTSISGFRRVLLQALLGLSLLLGFTSAAVAQTCPVSGAGTAGATVTTSALARALGGIQVAETGAFTDTYTVKLDSRPTHDVVVTATAALKPLAAFWPKPLKPPRDAVELRVAGASAWSSTVTLRFTPSNWCRPQRVTIKGIDDYIHNAPGGARRAIIKHEAASGDDDYDGMDIESLEVMATDNEPSWRLIPEVVSARVAEGGTVDITFTVRPVRKLWHTPVRITLAPASGASNPAENADLPKTREMTVTIPANTPTLKTSFTLPDDLLDEGDEKFTITFHRPWGIDFIERGRRGLNYLIDVVIIDDDGPTTTPKASFASGSQSAAESAGTRNVTVNLSPAPKTAISLDYTVGGTAASGADYKALSGTLAVSPGAGSVNIPVVLTDDSADEASETVVLTLTAGSGYAVAKPSVHTLTITDDDAPPQPEVTIAADAASKTEGAAASFTLTADPKPAASLPVSVTVAAVGSYGVTAGKRTVTIPSSGSAKLTLSTTGDAVDEADGSVTVTVGTGNGYTVGIASSGTVAILDDDDPPLPEVTIAADAASKTEGAAASFTLTADPKPAASLPVSVTVATVGSYGVTAGKRTVTIPSSGSTTLTLSTTGDAVDEPDGSVTVTVNAGSGYTVSSSRSSGTVSILDDDLPPQPEVTIAADAASKTEGAAASFTLTADPKPAASLPVSVTVAAVGSYGITAGKRTVTIPSSGSTTLTLATTGDAVDEPDGSVTVTVNTGDGYTVSSSRSSGKVAILDDDLPPPEITIAADAAAITEGGDAAFTVTADRAPDADLVVSLTVSEAAGSDFVAAAHEGPATVTIPKGGTSAAFTVATVNDAADEPDGSVTVALGASDGYTLGSASSGTVAITDDDPAPALPVVSLGDDLEALEHRFFQFRVTLSAAAAHEVRVRWFAEPETARYADFAPISGSVRFSPGERERTFVVFPVNDGHDEDPETFRVVLLDVEGATIGDGVAVGTIVNSDPMPAAWLSRFGRTVAEQVLGGITARMSATRTGLLNNPGLGSGWYGGSRGGGEGVPVAHKVLMCAHSAFPGNTGPPEGE